MLPSHLLLRFDHIYHAQRYPVDLCVCDFVYIKNFQHSSFAEEHKQTYGLLLMIDRILAKFSPVVIMQRFIRGWFTRLRLKKSGISLPKFVSLCL